MRQLYFSAEQRRYEWRDVDEPRLASETAALVRPLAVARCDLDAAIARGRAPAGRDFAVGHEVIAEVVDVGDAVARTHPGDRVIVPFQISCGRCSRCTQGLTRACLSVPPMSVFGLPGSDVDWGGGFSDLMSVPYADAMLVPTSASVDPTVLAASADNLPDGYRLVGPGLTKHPGASVLVLGGRGAPSCGLYAVACAVALGAGSVDYVDTEPERLRIAEQLGARCVERRAGDVSGSLGSYPVTADATATEVGLALALRSTAPEGVCTGVGGFMPASTTSFPFTLMYLNNVTLRVEMVNARAELDRITPLLRGDQLELAPVVTARYRFEEAPEAMALATAKVVFVP